MRKNSRTITQYCYKHYATNKHSHKNFTTQLNTFFSFNVSWQRKNKDNKTNKYINNLIIKTIIIIIITKRHKCLWPSIYDT